MVIINFSADLALTASSIYASSWKSAYKNIIPQQYLDNISPDHWVPLLLDTDRTVFLIYENDEYIAVSSSSAARDENMNGWGEIISVYVLPQYLNKGFGKNIFSYTVDYLQKQGYENIYLWVLEDNTNARKFYECNGFYPNGDKKIVNIGGRTLSELRYVNLKAINEHRGRKS